MESLALSTNTMQQSLLCFAFEASLLCLLMPRVQPAHQSGAFPLPLALVQLQQWHCAESIIACSSCSSWFGVARRARTTEVGVARRGQLNVMCVTRCRLAHLHLLGATPFHQDVLQEHGVLAYISHENGNNRLQLLTPIQQFWKAGDDLSSSAAAVDHNPSHDRRSRHLAIRIWRKWSCGSQRYVIHNTIPYQEAYSMTGLPPRAAPPRTAS